MFRPLHDRVLISEILPDKVSKGGIHIPENAQQRLGLEKGRFAKVLAVGPGKTLDDNTVRPLDVKVGDEVMFGKYDGNEVTLDGEKLIILREDSIMAVIERGE